MVHQLHYIIGLLVLGMVTSFHIAHKRGSMISSWMKPKSSSSPSSSSLSMLSPSYLHDKPHRNIHVLYETIAPVEVTSPYKKSSKKEEDDFSKYAVGQEYDGKLLSALKFGVFVDIGTGSNVLLPRSLLGTSYDRLRKLVEAKSEETIKIQITSVNAENRTLSGKFVGNKAATTFRARPDLSTLNAKELETKQFEATIVSAHDFGVFAEIEELGVEGLIPVSFLPEGTNKANVKSSFKKGEKITVKVNNINVEDKKLVLSARLVDIRSDPSRIMPSENNPEKWIQGVVQSVANFGLFVRPAGMDSVGLLHQSRVPRELITNLKTLAPIPSGSNKSDIESLFTVGDVLRIRIQTIENNKMELSALPYLDNEEDDMVDDDMIDDEEMMLIEGLITEKRAAPQQTDEDGKPIAAKKKFRDDDAVAEDSVEADDNKGFNPNSVLLWWRGKPYDASLLSSSTNVDTVDEQIEVLGESKKILEGTWRRLFDIDMRDDEADFSIKAQEAEMEELEEEIGELAGLDDDLAASDFGLGSKWLGNSVGAHIAFDIPVEWREKLTTMQQFDEQNKIKLTLLKTGKKGEKLEFEAVMREAEADQERRSKRPEPTQRDIAMMEGSSTNEGLPIVPVHAVVEPVVVAEAAVAEESIPPVNA